MSNFLLDFQASKAQSSVKMKNWSHNPKVQGLWYRTNILIPKGRNRDKKKNWIKAKLKPSMANVHF